MSTAMPQVRSRHGQSPSSPNDGHKKRVLGKDAKPKPIRQWIKIALFSVSTLCMFADQNLMAPNLSAIAADFKFSDEEKDQKLGGEINFSFFILGGIVSLFIGPLADSLNRVRLFVGVLLLGSLPALLTLHVSSFHHFFYLRTLTGLSIGGALPVLFALTSDLFPPSKRTIVSATLGTAMGVGNSAGQALAGWTGPTWGWRWPFVMVAVPAVLNALLILLFVSEPARGAFEYGKEKLSGHTKQKEEQAKPLKERISLVFKVATNRLMFAQSMPGSLPWGVLGTYMLDYLYKDKGLSVGSATSVMLMFGCGCILGGMLGGVVGQLLYNRRKSLLPLFVGACTMAGALPFLLLVNGDPAAHISFASALAGPQALAGNGSGTAVEDAGALAVGLEASSSSSPRASASLTSLCLSFVGGLLAAVAGPNLRAVAMNVNEAEVRGSVFAILTIVDDLGRGLGPAIVALMVRAYGRRVAFSAAFGCWLLCGAILMTMSATIVKDGGGAAQQRARKALAGSGRTRAASGGGGDAETTALMADEEDEEQRGAGRSRQRRDRDRKVDQLQRSAAT